MKRKVWSKYILNNQGEPKAVDDRQWMEWFKNQPERSTQIVVTCLRDARISTIFLYHGGYKNPPVFWETMCFGGPPGMDRAGARCGGSREQAYAQHEVMVKRLEQAYAVHFK